MQAVAGYGRAEIKIIASVFAILCALVVCIGFLHVQQAEAQIVGTSNSTVVRGVVDNLSDFSKDKNAELGTAANPFVIVEIVPYEEYAEIGYLIGGCEPVDMVAALNDNNYQYSTPAIRVGTYGSDDYIGLWSNSCESYFFSDEPEYTKYTYAYGSTKSVGTSVDGYYERVASGEGTFTQDIYGSFTKTSNGNIIWHTVNEDEKLLYPEWTFNDSTKILSSVGDRMYTQRTVTSSDTCKSVGWISYYRNSEHFLTDTLCLSDSEIENYSIVVKTITAAELNENQGWIDVANLFYLHRTAPNGDSSGTYTSLWKTYNRLGHSSSATSYTDTFEGSRDLSWSTTMKLFYKITADTDFAPIMWPMNVYMHGAAPDEWLDSVTFDIMDWDLESSGVSTNTEGSCNNVFKLAVMTMTMDTNLFKQLYLDGSTCWIDNNGLDLLQKNSYESGGLADANAANYWTMYTFLLSPEYLWYPSEHGYDSWFGYWNSDEAWENYRIYGSMERYDPYIKGHVFSFGNQSMLSQYTQDVMSKDDTDIYWDDFRDYMDDYDEGWTSASFGDAVRYILGLTKSGSLRVLDVEPCYDGTDAWSSSENGWLLTEDDIKTIIPNASKNYKTIEITHMTTAAFNGLASDIIEDYDLIYLGLQDGGYNLNTGGSKITLAEGDGTSEYLPDWNDNSMDGLIYFSTGDAAVGSIRFPSNDITALKKAKLQSFLNAGHPIIAENVLYDLNSSVIDKSSNMYSFVAENVGNSTLYSTDDGTDIFNALKAYSGSSDGSADSGKAGNSEGIAVLQLLPNTGSSFKLSSNSDFMSYLNSVSDYNISIDTMTLAEFGDLLATDEEEEEEDGEENKTSEIETPSEEEELYLTYDLIILGFGENYDGSYISENETVSNFINYWAESGKGIIFTHDFTDTDYTDFRDVMVMDRETSDGLGYTYDLTRQRGSTGGSYEMPYSHLVSSTSNGFGSGESYTTKITRLNHTSEYDVTNYPYVIDETITVGSTHGQNFELDMEDPDLVVWYCLGNGGDGGVTYGVSPNDASNNYYLYSEGNVFYTGVGCSTLSSAMEEKLLVNTIVAAYRASYTPYVTIENDAANSTDNEVQTTTSLMSHRHVSEYHYLLEANDATAYAYSDGSFVADDDADFDDQYVKVYFTPQEFNDKNPTLELSIYTVRYSAPDDESEDSDSNPMYDYKNWSLYQYSDTDASLDGGCFGRIYVASTGASFTATNGVFSGVVKGQTYYMYVPKSMLSSCDNIMFELGCAENTGAGHTRLNVDASGKNVLFMLD